DATAVANHVLPTVVTISATNGTTINTGSGEVIRPEGHIVTNNHVVSLAANAGTISVLFSNGVRLPATIIGRDPQTDLAVIKVESTEPLAPITFGPSSHADVGDHGVP